MTPPDDPEAAARTEHDDEVDAYVRSFAALGPAPSFSGTVKLVVARKADEVKEILSVGRLTQGDGLVGDRWRSAGDPTREMQLTLMNARVVTVLSSGRGVVPDAGDNLLVDLDLGEEALPLGARVRVGTALVEVTAKAHTGCGKFSRRFGSAALRWVNGKPRRSLRLRGVHARVLEEGEVRAGDAAVVLDDDGR